MAGIFIFFLDFSFSLSSSTLFFFLCSILSSLALSSSSLHQNHHWTCNQKTSIRPAHCEPLHCVDNPLHISPSPTMGLEFYFFLFLLANLLGTVYRLVPYLIKIFRIWSINVKAHEAWKLKQLLGRYSSRRVAVGCFYCHVIAQIKLIINLCQKKLDGFFLIIFFIYL